jgi:hypothetical protein
VEKDGDLFISPIQYNADTHRWVNYHEADWGERPWLLKCGGCHASGVDLEKKTFVEPGVSCEACHGKGSWHAALPKTAVFEKRQTIINPAKLTMGVAVQICGSCHNRGKATKKKGAGWPVDYEPGKALEAYYTSITYGTDKKHMYSNEFSKGHHQQFIDWKGFPGSLFEPDSLVPRPKDLKDFFHHIGWFMGLKKAPQFDRWGYWEKFDYWAVFWGMVIMGTTGLLLAYPLLASKYMPGWGLNVAFWIHRIEALLAMAHLFIIHFFIAHLRRHNFPMDRAMFEGSVSLDATRHEKPAWVSRLQQEGDLEGALVTEAGVPRKIIFYLFGYSAVAFGLFLLIGAISNIAYISW